LNKKELYQAVLEAHRDRFPDGLLTPVEVAQIVRLSPKTLATLRSRGGGPPAIKSGSRVYYRLQDVAAWFASRSKGMRS
jgi:predicted DNA-binding transcriptional regulator AlpA